MSVRALAPSPTTPRAGRRRRWAASACGALAAVALTSCTSDAPTATAPTSVVAAPSTAATATATASAVPSTSAVAPATGDALHGGPVLAVKIDNTSPARPRIGVDLADVVYVEPVEAGLTRLLAVFSSALPDSVGPVRSARESDVDLLGNYGRVAFAFSGGSAYTLAAVARGAQVNLSFDANPQGYHRDRSRPSPYNVIGSTSALLARAGGSVPPGDSGLRFGATPAGGSSGVSVSTAYQGASVAFGWDAGTKRYLLTTDGRPDVTAAGVRLGAAGVIVQQVRTHLSSNRDVNGVQTPVVEVIGSGSFTLLRDGKSWTGSWTRASRAEPTSFTLASGQPALLPAGPVWVVLVPAGQGVSVH